MKETIPRSKDGKFRKAEQPPAEATAAEEEQPRIKTKVTGLRTKMAAVQTHNLKFDEVGEALPELEGVEEDDE